MINQIIITDVRRISLREALDAEMQLRPEGEKNFPLTGKLVDVPVKFDPSEDRLVVMKHDYKPHAYDLFVMTPLTNEMPF